jgi:pSer/pThr/pTyr-binding forkhead associated (FHA) protein/DNA-binding CsgD family transcriptional regulator
VFDRAPGGGPVRHLGVALLQGFVVVTDDSPIAPHAATPAELRERIEAAGQGRPFLVLRDDTGAQVLIDLGGERERLSIGRSAASEVSLPWDGEVSRVHAELERIAGEWTIADDGLSRNGTFVNGARIGARHRLRDGEVVRVGNTTIAYQRPADPDARQETRVAAVSLTREDLSATQRKVLVALARPYKHGEFATPASNQAIAQELHLSVDAVKAQLRTLFQRFGIEHLAQNQKRSRLVAEAMRSGIVTQREL